MIVSESASGIRFRFGMRLHGNASPQRSGGESGKSSDRVFPGDEGVLAGSHPMAVFVLGSLKSLHPSVNFGLGRGVLSRYWFYPFS